MQITWDNYAGQGFGETPKLRMGTKKIIKLD